MTLRPTQYEDEICLARAEACLPALVHLAKAAVHRYRIYSVSEDNLRVLVVTETNDDNDDGIPDGRWETWRMHFPSVEAALKHTGKCRVGISGVIVTVTLDGKEVR